MRIRVLTVLCIPLLLLGFAAGCGSDDNGNPADTSPSGPGSLDGDASSTDSSSTGSSSDPSQASSPGSLGSTSDVSLNTGASDSPLLPSLTPGAIQATITMEDGGVIIAELYPDIAPQTVRNFVYLANQGFYDGLRFHRIISGFMIQGGCPDSSGSGGPGYFIKGEFASNGFENNLLHERGVLSMARRQYPNDSAGSQFFIMHANSPGLDGDYAAFGRVLEGMDVVDLIAQTPVYDNNGSVRPNDMPVIKSVTIDSDVDLPEPEKLQL